MSVLMDQSTLESVMDSILDESVNQTKRTLLFKMLRTQLDLAQHAGSINFQDSLKSIQGGKTFARLLDFLFDRSEQHFNADRKPKQWVESRLSNIKRAATESKEALEEQKPHSGFKVRIN
jgi:hypothetical protein